MYTVLGTHRLLVAGGYVDAGGSVFLDGAEVIHGRGGLGEHEDGRFILKLYNPSESFVRYFGIPFTSIEPLEDPTYRAEFWIRTSIGSLPANTPYTVAVFDEDGVTQLSKTTINGEPPVAMADDVVAACESHSGTAVTLDASGSYDPDGDTLHFKWESPGIPIIPNDGAIAVGLFSVGKHTATLTVSDGSGVETVHEVCINVVDTTPPSIDAPSINYSVCVPNAAEVELEVPAIEDACSDSEEIQVEAFIKRLRGIDAGMIRIEDGVTAFPTGTHEVEWSATDDWGNEAREVQTVIVTFSPGPDCCEDGQTILEGNYWADMFYHGGSPACILGYGGNDYIYTYGAGNDYIAAGNGGGGDYINTREYSTVVGEDDGDFFNFHCNSSVYGGNGGDHLSCYGTGDAVVFGGWGDDHIVTLSGNDIVNAGPGRDDVNTGIGDDEVYVYDVCELEDGKILRGGEGNDTLFLPSGIFEYDLAFFGVESFGFESIIELSPADAAFSDCI